jgi:ArsR family transcriptional regulator
MDKKIYTQNINCFKALSDENRLVIIDMLSCGELCACEILEKLRITQPTLSHHMKILCSCGLVNARKEGKWIYYSLNSEKIKKFKMFLHSITSSKDDCICR